MGNCRVPNRTRNKDLKLALLVGLLGGIVNVLVDLDHLQAGGRPAHLALGAVACLIALYFVARFGRLYLRMVLKKREPTGRFHKG